MRNQNFCPIKFWVLVSMCCSIIQLKQLTVHYRGLGSNAREHPVEGGKGAGLSLGVAAHSPIDLSATWAHPKGDSTSWQVWEHGRCMSGSANSNTYSFLRAVCQRIQSFTSEQMPELLSKWMRRIMDQVFPQSMISKCLAVQSMGSMRRRHSQCYCTHWPLFCTLVGLVLFSSSSSGPIINALNQI